MSKAIGILRKLMTYLTSQSLMNMYYAFVFPYLHYCNEVWGATYVSHLNRLILLQKRAIRIIAKTTYLAHTRPLFKQYRILKLQQINIFVLGRFMFRLHDKDLPVVFDQMFTRNTSLYTYSTRQCQNLHVPRAPTNMIKMSIRYRGVIVWNKLCKYLDSECTLATFKSRMKLCIIQNNLIVNWITLQELIHK